MVEYRLEIEPGAVVDFRLMVINKGQESCCFDFSSSQEYDFLVERDGQRIWQWSDDKAFAMMMHEKTLPVGREDHAYRAGWDRKDSQGNQVEQGSYTVKAFFLGVNKRRPVAEMNFVLP